MKPTHLVIANLAILLGTCFAQGDKAVAPLSYDPNLWIGRWEGIWQKGNLGNGILNVKSVVCNAACEITITRSGQERAFPLEGNTFKYLTYNPKTNGDVVFKISEDGQQLEANYSNPIGGSNYAVMKKTPKP